MQIKEPKFMKSEFFVPQPGNWHLQPGAPDEIVREFTEFMAQLGQHTPPPFEPQDVPFDEDDE